MKMEKISFYLESLYPEELASERKNTGIAYLNCSYFYYYL